RRAFSNSASTVATVASSRTRASRSSPGSERSDRRSEKSNETEPVVVRRRTGHTVREASSSAFAQQSILCAALFVCVGCGNGDAKPGGGGSTDRIVLFDGANFDEWKPEQGDGPVPWQLVDDGSMLVVSGTGNIVSRRVFENLFVHIEYKTPTLPADVTGQDRGNSGV